MPAISRSSMYPVYRRWSARANRGVYPLGMSALNSGITPAPGFTYTNQFLYYARDEVTDDHGNTLPVTGQNYVAMDMNSLVWVTSNKPILGARYSATATLPFAKNDLTSDVQGNISGRAGFADSYYMPLILGWSGQRLEHAPSMDSSRRPAATLQEEPTTWLRVLDPRSFIRADFLSDQKQDADLLFI